MGPLRGIRVVDFSRLAPGPYGSMLLADLGADVIRVDRAPVGEVAGPPAGDVLGRGKRSVALDLKQPGGVEVAWKLIEGADVLLEGFRPGVMERLGLGPDEVLARNPRIVYARMTGWGQDGPLAPRAGHDINYIAISGALGSIGRKDEPPVPPMNLLGDFAGGGMFCALGILAALVERQTSGQGQVVDAAMVDGSANLLAFLSAGFQRGIWGPRGTNLLDTGAHFYEVYETADGKYMSVGSIEPQFYAELLDGLGLAGEDLPDQMDQTAWPQMKERLAAIFRTKTRDEWSAVFEDRDACVYPVYDPHEAPVHRHNAERGVYVEGPYDLVQPAAGPRLSRTPAGIAGPPPIAGEHTRKVLAELGYEEADIEELSRSGAVAWAAD